MNLLRPLILALAMLSASVGVAQDARNETVRFDRGTSGTTIQDSITGYETVRYSVGVTAGQRMSVQLDTFHPSTYFNITAPGAQAALFIGSIEGNGTSFVIPSSGNYIIDVYMMRNAARRNETADYTLGIYVE